MAVNEKLEISKADLDTLYKYTMEPQTSLGFYLCLNRDMNDEMWDAVKPVYQRYLQKNSSESMIDRHVMCNLVLLLFSIDMLYPYIDEEDDIYQFVDNTYNSFLEHDEHNVKEKWNECIKDNTWHPEAWIKLRNEIVDYLKVSKNEPYLSKDYCAVLNLVAKISQANVYDINVERNENRNVFLMVDHKFYESDETAYLDLFNNFEKLIETEEENKKLDWGLYK